MALGSFGLVPQLLYGSPRCLLSGVRVRAQASRAFWRRCFGGCKLILNARWCGFEQVRLSVAFSRGCAATRVTFVSMCRKQACESGSRASTHGVGWTSGMAWCVACPLWSGCKRSLCFSCCMLSHNRVRAQVNVELWRFISMDARNDVPMLWTSRWARPGVSAVC